MLSFLFTVIFNIALVGIILEKSWSSPMMKKLSLKMIFLKEDEMLIKFILFTGLKNFRKIILWIKELVKTDNEQLPPKKMKTLFKILSGHKKMILAATCCQERLKKGLVLAVLL